MKSCRNKTVFIILITLLSLIIFSEILLNAKKVSANDSLAFSHNLRKTNSYFNQCIHVLRREPSNFHDGVLKLGKSHNFQVLNSVKKLLGSKIIFATPS